MALNRIVCQPNGAQRKICQSKLVFLGESAVGKTSLILKFVKGQFHDYQENTIESTFLTRTVCSGDNTVKFEIWDAAGQERHQASGPTYYQNAQAAIVVYDLTNKSSFHRAKACVKELQRQASPNIVIALAGNKADLSSKRAVETAEANNYAIENGLLFMETSAKTAINVSEIFMAIADKLLKGEKKSNSNQMAEWFTFANGNRPVIKDNSFSKADSILRESIDMKSEEDEIDWSDHEDLRPI